MKKQIKTISLLFTFCIATTFAMSKHSTDTAVRIGVLAGPSGIPMAKQMESTTIGGADASYEVFAGAAQLLPKLIKGEIDIGFLPPNMAAKVYNINNKAIVTAGISGGGMLYLITKDNSIKTLQDLRGKTVTVAGQGATPDFMLRYLLSREEIGTDGQTNGVILDFSIPNAEIAPALISDKIEYALVPEPFATAAQSKNPEIIRALDIQKIYQQIQNTKEIYPMTLIVANAEFAQEHADILKSFLKSYKGSSEWTKANPEKAGKLAEQASIGLTASVAEKAIPNCAYMFESATKGRESVESLLRVFMSFNSASIGGKLPDEEFYFK
ncbi:MAG: ABC transporter substrate-binding protein [Treponema sp.]|nr:ABC transporter substrate-binding protein [Treponema sp.]